MSHFPVQCFVFISDSTLCKDAQISIGITNITVRQICSEGCTEDERLKDAPRSS